MSVIDYIVKAKGVGMYDYIVRRVEATARYIIDNNATVRQAGEAFGVSKSTVHSDMTKRLKDIDIALYEEVRDILEYNFSVRHLRGGESTKHLYLDKSKSQENDT